MGTSLAATIWPSCRRRRANDELNDRAAASRAENEGSNPSPLHTLPPHTIGRRVISRSRRDRFDLSIPRLHVRGTSAPKCQPGADDAAPRSGHRTFFSYTGRREIRRAPRFCDSTGQSDSSAPPMVRQKARVNLGVSRQDDRAYHRSDQLALSRPRRKDVSHSKKRCSPKIPPTIGGSTAGP